MKHSLLSIVIFLNLLWSGSAYSWGADGHQAVARIAWSRMSPDVQKAVTELLASGYDAPSTKCAYSTIEEAATWLDCVRGAGLSDYFATYYHADRFTHCPAIVIPTKCKTGHCASDALNLSIKQLSDPAATIATRRIALKAIIHLVGDLHQPLHVERDANSFSVTVGESNTAIGFHEYWDKDVIAELKKNQPLIDKLVLKFATKLEGGQADEWVKETFEESKDIIYGAELKSSLCNENPAKFKVNLTANYRREASHYAYYKIAQAGVRLNALLSSILKK